MVCLTANGLQPSNIIKYLQLARIQQILIKVHFVSLGRVLSMLFYILQVSYSIFFNAKNTLAPTLSLAWISSSPLMIRQQNSDASLDTSRFHWNKELNIWNESQNLFHRLPKQCLKNRKLNNYWTPLIKASVYRKYQK